MQFNWTEHSFLPSSCCMIPAAIEVSPPLSDWLLLLPLKIFFNFWVFRIQELLAKAYFSDMLLKTPLRHEWLLMRADNLCISRLPVSSDILTLHTCHREGRANSWCSLPPSLLLGVHHSSATTTPEREALFLAAAPPPLLSHTLTGHCSHFPFFPWWQQCILVVKCVTTVMWNLFIVLHKVFSSYAEPIIKQGSMAWIWPFTPNYATPSDF